jgi:mannose-6-phosphate isomerase-like protein (cupin superfamily)
MLNRIAIVFLLSSVSSALWAGDESYPPGVYKNGPDLMAALAKAAQIPRTHPAAAEGSVPIANADHYRINMVYRKTPGVAMTHAVDPAKGSELHYIVDGSATVVTGGKLSGPNAGPTTTIVGGETRRVSKGDVLFLPAGTPHWYKEINGSVTYLEVRFDVELKK